MSDINNLGNKKILARNLSHYMNINSIDASKICKDLSIAPSTFSEWTNAKKYPRIDKLEMLANYFNIKKSDLIEDKIKDNVFDETEILFDKYKDILTDDDKETIRFLIEKRKREIDKQLGDE